jgi:PP-loop superfamily ATP-utilizing enzyme
VCPITPVPMPMKHLLARVARKGLSPEMGLNLIAFSGGVDSSVVSTLAFTH